MLTLENLSFDVNDEKGEIGIIKDISFTVDDGNRPQRRRKVHHG